MNNTKNNLYFKNDYSCGFAPEILENINKTNFNLNNAYHYDSFSEEASNLIKEAINKPNAYIEFLSGGTQCNIIAAAAFLKPYEAIICSLGSHICEHECGSIENVGRRILNAPSYNGKIEIKDIEAILNSHHSEHMVIPRMLQISQATELGTAYTKDELYKLGEFCKKNNLLFYIDGARLAQSLTSPNATITLTEFANCGVDAFYFGGTKNGACSAEAFIILNESLKQNFKFYLKQNGFITAKSWLHGLQFKTLFTNNYWQTLSKHSTTLTTYIKTELEKQQIICDYSVDANQLFLSLPKEKVEVLQTKVHFEIWKNLPNNASQIRLTCSWENTIEEAQELLSLISNFSLGLLE